MKKEEKYYTPTIEEFHVGFEFESEVDSEMFQVKKGTWTKLYMTTDMMKDLVLNDDVWENVRVKYLDKEDLEELGFKYNPIKRGDHGYTKYSKSDTDIEIWGDKRLQVMKRSLIGDSYLCIFAGKIKNKSELKKLLTQLGV